jgi:hypothetical protein
MLRSSPNLMLDFKGIFYDTRCLLLHADPYKDGEPLRVYLAEGGKLPQFSVEPREVLRLDVYPPTTSLFVAPFAMLPWGLACRLWMMLTAVAFILAAFLIWDIGSNYAPVISGCLICFAVANTQAFFAFGNPAGIVVSLCMVAVWCFLEERYVWAGVLCLAVSLAMKPHDAGFMWLYFLLAGGVYRKRALQTFLVTAVLGLAAILWVTPIAPHWMQELHSNLLVTSAPGGTNDPGHDNSNSRGPGIIIELQSVVAVFRDDPRIYNPVSYLVCGALLLVWAARTLRARFSQRRAWLALATVVPLALLAAYHRPHDAKLLLLAVPACAMLWAEGGPLRWVALAVTTAGIVSTGGIPLIILVILTKNLQISTAGLSGQILMAVLTRPVPLILLAMGIFYLWIYMRRAPTTDAAAGPGEHGGNAVCAHAGLSQIHSGEGRSAA